MQPLRAARNRACLIAIAAMALHAQAPPASTVPDQKRLAYYNAYRAWREADPSLEHDLGAAPTDDLHRRIDAARVKALAYSKARMDYYNAILVDYTRLIAQLADSSRQLAFDDIVASVKSQRQAVAAQVAATSKEVDALGAERDKTLQRQAADRQWIALLSIENNLGEELRQLEETAKSGAASGSLRAKLLQHYQSATALLRQEIDFTRQEGALWQAYYDSLARALNRRATAMMTTRNAQPISVAPATPQDTHSQPPALAKTPDPAVNDEALTRWAGDWTYNPLNGKSYFGPQPDFVNIHIAVANGVLQGSYTARYKLPKGVHGSPDVAFSFDGALVPGDRQKFTLRSADGLSGTVEMHYLGAKSMEVVWNRPTNNKVLDFGDEIVYRR